MTDINNTGDSHDHAVRIRRRDFLILSSAAAVGALAISAVADFTKPASPVSPPLPLSLGFVDELVNADQPRALVNASRLGSSHALGAAARVRIRGIVRAGSSSAGSAVALDAIYRVEELGHREVPFLAWSDQHSSRRGFSSAAGFVVPVGERTPLTLALTARVIPNRGAALARRLLRIPAPPQAVRGTATLLRHGVYFIAVPGTGTEPNWSSVRAIATEGKLPRLEQATLFGMKPVSFDYIVVETEQV